MTKQVELLEMLERAENQRSARRSFIRLCGGAAAMTGGLALLSACGDDDDSPTVTPTPTPSPVSSADAQDIAVLSFALQLEYLEANFYSYAVTGNGIATALQTGVGTQGAVITGSGTGAARAVSFTDPVIAQYAREIAADEIAHVTFLRTALGTSAPAQPTINLSGSATVTAPAGSVVGAFTAAARAAGVIGATDTFDPYASDINFLIGSYLLTDVGVSAYRGSARLITNKTFLEASAGILATEAYHDGVIRSSIYARGISATPPVINAQNVFQVIQKVSDARDSLDGATDLDQGIGDATTANLVPTDANGLVLGRTAAQVLNVVYLNAAAGTSSGGFFPAGLNGTIRTTT
jgi:hypothetical protein